MSTTRNRKIANKGIGLRQIKPLTDNQKTVFEEFNKNQNLFLHGVAGTGKTFISLFLALKEIRNRTSQFERIVIIRSAVATRSVGFLPGTLEEKLSVYESIFENNVNYLYNSPTAYSRLKSNKVIEFMSTSFIRGHNFENTIIIVDEAQNLSFHECDSVITRLGKDCRIIFCGDLEQSDIYYNNNKNGLEDFLDILETMKSFSVVDFTVEDVVRSGLVKEYILAKEAYFSEMIKP